jgi:quercetin dioxygenase-like cupin family protein
VPGPVSTVDLLAVDRSGPDGAQWSLPHDGDLDANLVRLGPGGEVGEHVNDDVDVLVVGIFGGGVVTVDGIDHDLRPGVAILVPKGSRRRVRARPRGEVGYLTAHRARAGIQVRTAAR